MTLEDRIATLRDLLPGLQDFHYEALAAEHASQNLECHWLNDLRLPIVDVMMRLRFNDAKVLRVKAYCGANGATLLDQCYGRFRTRLAGEEVHDFTVALEVAAQAKNNEVAAEVINELNAEQGRAPAFDFDLRSVQAMMAAQSALKHHGFITPSTPLRDAIGKVRWLTRKALADTRMRTMEELLGVARPRSEQPNMLFADGYFGDGTRLVTVTLEDGTTVQRRTSLIEPLVESFVGKNPMEIESAIRERVEAARAKATKAKHD
jgi:hypothetical protein